LRGVLKIAVIGGLNSLISFTACAVLVTLGAHYTVASVFALLAGFLNSIYFGKTWLFRYSAKSNTVFVSTYVKIYLIQQAAAWVGLWFFIDVFAINKYLAYFLNVSWLAPSTYFFLNLFLGQRK
jgi:hypothetical protein